jgi:hypothetical protein
MNNLSHIGVQNIHFCILNIRLCEDCIHSHRTIQGMFGCKIYQRHPFDKCNLLHLMNMNCCNFHRKFRLCILLKKIKIKSENQWYIKCWRTIQTHIYNVI